MHDPKLRLARLGLGPDHHLCISQETQYYLTHFLDFEDGTRDTTSRSAISGVEMHLAAGPMGTDMERWIFWDLFQGGT